MQKRLAFIVKLRLKSAMNAKCKKGCSPEKPKKKVKNKQENQILLSQYAKALGHPIRVQILRFLKKQEACICGDVVDALPLAQATVSQHLKVLKEAGLVRGTISGPATCYCIDHAAIKELQSLIKQL